MVSQIKKNLPLICITVSGVLLRFFKLGQLIFQLDEPYHTVQISAESLPFLLTHDYGSIVYQVFVHFLMPLGKLEFFSRLPAALFGTLIILATYFVGKLLFGKKEGLIAALFVSFSHFFLSYSQEARGYTTFAFFSLLSLFFFYKALRENRPKYWMALVVFTVLGAYTHLISLVPIISYSVFVGISYIERIARPRNKRSWDIDLKRLLNFVLSTLLIFVLVYLLLSPIGQMDGETSTQSWLADELSRILGPPTVGFFQLVQHILTRQIYQFPSVFYFLAVSFIALGILGSLFRLSKEDLLILLYVILPVFAFYLIKPRPLFFMSAHRYFIYTLPLIFILIVKGMRLLGSFLVSAAKRFKMIRTKEYFYRNLFFSLFVACFFLLECLSLMEYSVYDWKLRSLKISREVHEYFKDNAQRNETLHLDSFPNSAGVLFLSPFDTHRGKKRLLVRLGDMAALERMAKQKLGTWLVVDSDTFREWEKSGGGLDLKGAKVFRVGEQVVMFWGSEDTPLLESQIKMVEFLIPLCPDREKEYRLWLAKLHLYDLNLNEALTELGIATTSSFPDSEEIGKDKTPLPFIQKIMPRLKNHQKIVTGDHVSEITRQLWIYGNELLAGEEWEAGISALDMCVQLSEKEQIPVAKKYFSLGNQFLRTGKTEEAILLINKAISMYPDNYFYHLILAEAYREKGMTAQAIQEYKQGFNLPSLSDEFTHQIMAKPQLFAIWNEEGNWHFLWRSDERCDFSGNLYFSKKLGNFETRHFSKKDIINESRSDALEFDVFTINRQIKILDIEIGKRAGLTCYVELNGQLEPENILILNLAENPKEIPFSLSPMEMF